MAAQAEEINLKTKLEKLHCPFTWEILNNLIKHSFTGKTNDEDMEIKETSCALELLIHCLLKTYKYVMSTDKENAKKNIEKAEELLMQIQQERDMHRAIRAIEHVFYATKCFYLYDTEDLDEEIEEILTNIVIDIEDFNNEEMGALYGCQSVVWSFLNDFGMNKAIEMAKKAIEMDQDCALWHFVLAKNLRRRRRSVNVASEPTEIEKNHFELAYAMSNKNSVFGIYFLQMKMEAFHKYSRDRDFLQRKNINKQFVIQEAKEILQRKPNNTKVLLKLALLFLRLKDDDETMSVKKCLDAVKEMAPTDSTYLHYTAMMYQQCGDFREALKFYKKAADCNNFVAELAYIEYGWETGELEPLPHLHRMLKKYDQSIQQRQIAMLLATAVTYYSVQEDMRNAAEYFLRALTLDPSSNKFKGYYKFLEFRVSSIFNFLNYEFCPRIKGKYPDLYEKIKALLNVKNITDLTKDVENLSVAGGDSSDIN